MAMSRAAARFAATKCVTKLMRFSFDLPMASCMVWLVEQAILNQALREPAEGLPAGTTRYRNCVIIHRLT